MMFSWNDFKNLHVVKQSQNMIYKWWKTDTLIIPWDALEENPQHFLQNYAYKNLMLKELFQKPELCQSFFKICDFYHKKDYEGSSLSFMEKWEDTGLLILLIPLKTYSKHPIGFITALAFLTESNNKIDSKTDSNKEQIKQLWLKQNFSADFCTKYLPTIPTIKQSEKKYFIDLMELIAGEILSVQKELVDKKQIKHIQTTKTPLRYGNIVGHSKAMLDLYNLLEQIKASTHTVLIQGENGTGKELIAQSIHKNSPRATGAFVVQNCSALNDNLLESELFGHVKGSFTGAYKDKIGLFETAHNGTFFLDEIGDTSQAMQVKLLRVIQDGTFFPVGAIEPKTVNVRIIAATNKDLKDMTTRRTFREDLYYRLNVIHIPVPPLRQRVEDIALLAEFFINRISSEPKIFTRKALDKLIQYPWPGNVRELQNEAERLAVFSSKNTYIKEEFLSEKIRDKESNRKLMESLNSQSGKIMKKAIAELECRLIARCLKQEGWNKTRVAKKLGISRAALVAKVKDYHLERRTPLTPIKRKSPA